MNTESTAGMSACSELLTSSNLGVTYSTIQELRPLYNTNERFNDIQFLVEGNHTFIDLAGSLLKIILQVTKNDGSTVLPTGEDVSTINNLIHSLLRAIEVELAGYPITSITDKYAFIAMFWTLLGFGLPYKTTAATAGMFYQDSKGDDYTSTNTGMTIRKSKIAGSKEVELIAPLFIDLAQQKKYILNNVDVRIKLIRNSDDFVLWSPTARTTGSNVCPYTVKILSATYYVKRHTLSPNLFNRIQMELNKKAVRYNYDRCEMKSFNINSGLTSGTSDNLLMGQIPQLVVIAMNKSADVNGKLNTNPFNFQHFNVKKMTVSVDNDPALYRSLEFNIDANQYLNGYMTLFTAAHNRDLGNNLTMDDYLNGYFFNVFELACLSAAGDLIPERRGRLKVDLEFEKALTEPITILIFAQYQAYIDIDKNRVVKSSI